MVRGTAVDHVNSLAINVTGRGSFRVNKELFFLCIGVQFIVNGVLGIATDPAVVRAIRDAAVGR